MVLLDIFIIKNCHCRYLINFLLDSSLGLLIIFVGIRLCQYLARTKGWEAINFGEYGKYSQ